MSTNPPHRKTSGTLASALDALPESALVPVSWVRELIRELSLSPPPHADREGLAPETGCYTVADLEKMLSKSRARIYALAASNKLPTIRFGRSLLFPKARIDRLLGGDH